MADRNSGVVGYHPFVKCKNGLICSFQPANLVSSQVVDRTLKNSFSANIDSHILDWSSKHGICSTTPTSRTRPWYVRTLILLTFININKELWIITILSIPNTCVHLLPSRNVWRRISHTKKWFIRKHVISFSQVVLKYQILVEWSEDRTQRILLNCMIF